LPTSLQERGCRPFSPNFWLSRKRQLKILLGQMRCKTNCCSRRRESVSHAIPGSTAGILECLQGPWAVKGSQQGSHRRQHQQAPGTGPANIGTWSGLSRSWPRGGAAASRPALACVPAPTTRRQRPGISQRRGYCKATASLLCLARAIASIFPFISAFLSVPANLVN
jgi:hypothetical protein